MSKNLFPLFTQLGGTKQDLPSHMVGPQAWWSQIGLRTTEGGLSAVPAKRLGATLPGNKVIMVLNATENTPYTHIFLASTNLRVYDISPEGDQVQLPWYNSTGDLSSLVSPASFGPDPVSWTVFDQAIYFTQLGLPGGVWKVTPRGVTICGTPAWTIPLTQTTRTALPSARYIGVFFDHLFLANVNWGGNLNANRLRWSNLREFAVFNPTRKNEADWYDFLDSEKDRYFGITGMHIVNDLMFILTPASVNIVRYVGLPRVIRVHEGVAKVGNDFPFGSINVHGTIWFISERAASIFVFNGQSSAVRGKEIIRLFINDLTTDPRYRYNVRAYHDEREGEIVWAYCGKGYAWGGATFGATVLNSELVHNYRTNTWYFRRAPQGEFIEYFPCGGALTAKPIGVFSEQIQSLNQSIDDLSQSANSLQLPFWVGKKLNELNVDIPVEVYNSDDKPAGTLDDRLTASTENMVLETGDFDFGAPAHVKEVESMFLDCDFDPEEATLKIEVAARKGLSETLTWKAFTITKTPLSMQEQRVSLPRCAGRFFRFRFTLQKKAGVAQLTKWVWKGFAPYVYGLPENTNSPEK